jgi:hypothetical protein
MSVRAQRPLELSRAGYDWFDLLTASLTFLVVTVCLIGPRPAELMQADSQSYLDFQAMRTAAYPFFLRAVRHLPEGLQAVPLLQLGFYGATAWFLAACFRRLSDNRIAAVALLALLLGNGQVTRLAFMIMTESLFIGCFMILLGLLCRLARAPNWHTLALVSLTAGLAVLVRPVGCALFAALPVGAWWTWGVDRHALRAAAAATTPFLMCIGIGLATHHAEHGESQTQSLLAINLFGKAAAIVDASVPSTEPAMIKWMAGAVAPDRALIDRSPTLADRFRLLVPYYDIWRGKALRGGLQVQTGASAGEMPEIDRIMLRLSVEILTAKPRAYLDDVALNYAALWWLPDAMTHTELSQFRAWLDELGPLPDLGTYPAWHQEHADAAIWALHGLIMIALATSVWISWRVICRLVMRRGVASIERFGFAAGLLVHTSFLLTAAFQAGLPRYVWAMWPGLSILVVTGLLLPFRALRGSWASRSTPRQQLSRG